MTAPGIGPGIPPRGITRWSRWRDPADPRVSYLAVAEAGEQVAVRVAADATHPASGRVVYVSRRDFGRRYRRVA